MDAKQAVGIAKSYVIDLFSDEKLENLGLEEIELDDTSGFWRITLGFSRRWDMPTGVMAVYGSRKAEGRTYKVVSVREDGTVASVKQREGLPA